MPPKAKLSTKSTKNQEKQVIPPPKQKASELSPLYMTLLKTTGKSYKYTSGDIQNLIDVTYPKGNKKIINDMQLDILYEILGMIRQGMNPSDLLEFLTNTVQTPEDVMWKQPPMNIYKANVDREILLYQVEDEGIKGVGKCKYCSSTELSFATKQLRSGDEPPTTFVRCVVCDKNWKLG